MKHETGTRYHDSIALILTEAEARLLYASVRPKQNMTADGIRTILAEYLNIKQAKR